MQHDGGFFRLVRRIAALGVVVAFAASCGSSNDSSSTATTTGASATTAAAVTTPASTAGSTAGSAAGSGDVCAERDALRSSVAALKSVDLVAGGTNGAKAAISAVKDDLAALRTSAGSELQPQVQAVQDDIDQLETAVGNLDSGGGQPSRDGGVEPGDLGGQAARLVEVRSLWSGDVIDHLSSTCVDPRQPSSEELLRTAREGWRTT